MDRKSFYFKQPVAYTELNEAFDQVETAIHNVIVDVGLTGLISGMQVSQHSPSSNLTVDVQPGTAYDELGERILVETVQNINCAVDYLSTNTAVVTSGHTKILSLFAVFERALSDPRTDGNGATVYFEQAEAFKFNIVQGTEGGSPTPPALVAGWLLIADITIAYNQTAIVNANISTSRTQYAVNPSAPPAATVSCPAASGTTFSLAAGNLVSQLLAIKNSIDGSLTNGVPTILQAGSISALRAISTFPTNAVYTVPGFGLFVYSTGSSATDDGLFVVKPTSVSGNGRWLSLTSQIGVANGIAKNDSTSRVAAANVRNGLISVQSVKVTGTGQYANRSTSGFGASGASISFTGAVAGDIVLATCSFNSVCASGMAAIGPNYALAVTDNGSTNVAGETQLENLTATQVPMTMTLEHTVTGTGPATVSVALYFQGDGSHASFIYGGLSLVGTLIRP